MGRGKTCGCVSNIKPWHCKWLNGGIWLPLWQVHYERKSSDIVKKRRLNKPCVAPMSKKRLTDKRWRFICDALCRKRRKCEPLCDRRCNAKQCTVLWMGRQVLYEWRGSCDRSTSRSRYFSLTVNKRTQGISPFKQYQNATRNGRDVHENTTVYRLTSTSKGRGDLGVNMTPFLSVFMNGDCDM